MLQDVTQPEFIRAHLGISNPQLASLDYISDAGGLTGSMQRLTVQHPIDSESTQLATTTTSFIVKSISPEVLDRSKTLQLAREALFYKFFGSTLHKYIPKIHYSKGDLETGEKLLVMQDLSLSHIQSGYCFGQCSPHNWGKDLEALTGCKNESTERKDLTLRVALHAFRLAAGFHARFWKERDSLVGYSWLRGVEWMQGRGEKEWTAHQLAAQAYWETMKEKIASGKTGVKWDARLVECMDSSFRKVSWAGFQNRIQDSHYGFSLVHGDYHPANMMWKSGATESEDALVLLDWEVVGVGSGPQDCSQFVISHMYPHERKGCENQLIEEYYSSLLRGGVSSQEYSFDKCKADYVSGGVSRWVWLLGYTCGVCPDDWLQFFHDQVLAFIVDHGVTPDTIEMPRV
ncbi:kinase-like domain-containing protein [Obelidium mucronatum]|nr:kinase-like domain-containing protein [Obelidium mucronatum]